MAEASRISEIVEPGSLEHDVTTELVKEVLRALDSGTMSMRPPDRARYSIGATHSALIWLFNRTIKPHARLEAFEDMVTHMREEITRGLKEGRADG